ncbi:MAG: hypothetical protein ACLTBV_17330 [Enterocloster bolteae]
MNRIFAFEGQVQVASMRAVLRIIRIAWSARTIPSETGDQKGVRAGDSDENAGPASP